MVTRNNNRPIQQYYPAAAAAASGLAAAVIDNSVRSAVKSILNNNAPSGSQGDTIRERGRAKQRTPARQNKSRSNANRRSAVSVNNSRPYLQNRPGLPSLAADNSVRVLLKDVVALSNGSTLNLYNGAYTLSINTTIGSVSALGSVMPRFGTYGNLYREYYVNSIRCTFIPNSADTTGGSLAIGLDPEVFAGFPNSYGGVIRHRSSFFCDIKAGGTMTWTARQDAKMPKFCFTTAARDEDQLSFGVIQIYSNNTVAANTNIGNMMVELDVTFIGPT